jgi:hypothetical protein
MDVLGFISEWYAIRRDKKNYCKSCEILKEQLLASNQRERALLTTIESLNKPETIIKEVETPKQPVPIMPKHQMWAQKRAILEAEDRVKAAALRKLAEQEEHRSTGERSIELSVEELEKELAIGGDT